MPISQQTLARKIRSMVQGHDAIVARDGLEQLPRAFQIESSQDFQETAANIRQHIAQIVSDIAHYYGSSVLQNMETQQDESKSGAVGRNGLMALRAVMSMSNSSIGFPRTAWQTRTIDASAIEELPGFSDDDVSRIIGTSHGVFLFRRHSSQKNPWVYSWILVSDGVSISRGSMQPLHKCISALLKLTEATIYNDSGVQSAIAELEQFNTSSQSYYWYLGNQDIATHYITYSEATSSTSCMTKDHAFYRGTGPRQHPMDAYNDSPHWSLMFVSKQSPEQIVDMCTKVIDGRPDAHFEYPFVLRTMVLHQNHVKNARDLSAKPLVYAKTYGDERVAGWLASDISFFQHIEQIIGGRIKAIPSTNPDYQNSYILPYFDRANKAKFIKEADGSTWWEAVASIEDTAVGSPVACCSYELGIAKYLSAYSIAEDRIIERSFGHTLETFPTILGEELEISRAKYISVEINGNPVYVPKSMMVSINGRQVFRGATQALYDGTAVLREDIEGTPERFRNVDGLGWFDLNNAAHVVALSHLA